MWLLLLLILTLSTDQNPYRVLGVSQSATEQEIRRAFKELSLKYHPDRATEEHREKYASIVNAYELLKDPEKRKRYDYTGRIDDVAQRSGGSGFESVHDIFQRMHEQMRKHQQEMVRQGHNRRGQHFGFNDEVEIINYIDEFGRVRTAMIRRPKGLLNTFFESFSGTPMLYLYFAMIMLTACLLGQRMANPRRR